DGAQRRRIVGADAIEDADVGADDLKILSAAALAGDQERDLVGMSLLPQPIGAGRCRILGADTLGRHCGIALRQRDLMHRAELEPAYLPQRPGQDGMKPGLEDGDRNAEPFIYSALLEPDQDDAGEPPAEEEEKERDRCRDARRVGERPAPLKIDGEMLL